jgi:hypothetical protein
VIRNRRIKMHAPAALITLALAASASALAYPEPAVTHAPLLARDDKGCASAAASITAGIPSRPTGDAGNWIASNEGGLAIALGGGTKIKNIDDVCKTAMSTPTPPEQFASAFSSYNEALTSWQSSASSAVSSVIAAQCTSGSVQGLAAAGLQLALATDVPSCTNALKKYNDNLPSAAAATPRYLAAVAGVAGLVAAFALF